MSNQIYSWATYASAEEAIIGDPVNTGSIPLPDWADANDALDNLRANGILCSTAKYAVIFEPNGGIKGGTL